MSTSASEPKTLFFDLGDELPGNSNCLWLIKKGVIKSYAISEEGASITLGFWGAEDVVGQPLSKIRPCVFKCLTEVEIIAIPVEKGSTLSINMLCHAQQTQQLTYILRNTKIADRLWLFLEWLAKKFGRQVDRGRLIDFKLTHQELADTLGTTRITVTKKLKQFEQKGLIVRPKTKCIILTSPHQQAEEFLKQN